jgi:hypothetical protein
MIGRLVSNEMETMWNVVVLFRTLIRHLNHVIDENQDDIRIAGMQTNIQTRDLTKRKQHC